MMKNLCFTVVVLISFGTLFADEFVSPERQKAAEEMTDLLLHPEKPITDRRTEHFYQKTALRELFASFATRFARLNGVNLFDTTGNALRCGKLLEITEFRRHVDQETEYLDGACRMEQAAVIIRFGFSDENEIHSIRILRAPDRPAPEFMTTYGYYRHLNHFYSLVFLSLKTDEPPELKFAEHPEAAPKATAEPTIPFVPSVADLPRDRFLAEKFMHDVLYSKTRYSGLFDGIAGLNGHWKHDADLLGNLFRKMELEMARWQWKNVVQKGNALRCGKLLEVTGFTEYTHFDGTPMIQCRARMERAGVIVRLAFDPDEDKVASILVVRDPDQATPEFFPKHGYHENIDASPMPGRRFRIVATAVRASKRDKAVAAYAQLLKQADSPLEQPHRWKKPEEKSRWQDPATEKWWEPFEPSTTFEARRIAWQNGTPYSESGSFSQGGVFRWGRLPTGLYRIAACSCNPAMTYFSRQQDGVEFSSYLGEPVFVRENSPGQIDETILFTGDVDQNLAMIDAESGEALSGYFSVLARPENMPEMIRFYAHLDLNQEKPFVFKHLQPGAYSLFVRKLRGAMLESQRTPHRFEFDTKTPGNDWTVNLPRPHEGK